jgi:hypothetical protein
MSDILTLLAESEVEVLPISVEIVKGGDLKFRRPAEGEMDALKADARKEAKDHYKEEFKNLPQMNWLPAKEESFVRATVMSMLIEPKAEDPRPARKLLCQVAKIKPLTFDTIWNTFIEQAVSGELVDFAKEVEKLKKSSRPTGSDTSGSSSPETSTESTTTTSTKPESEG